jgi:hypothetical protein
MELSKDGRLAISMQQMDGVPLDRVTILDLGAALEHTRGVTAAPQLLAHGLVRRSAMCKHRTASDRSRCDRTLARLPRLANSRACTAQRDV